MTDIIMSTEFEPKSEETEDVLECVDISQGNGTEESWRSIPESNTDSDKRKSLTFHSLNDMGSNALPGYINCATFSLSFHLADDIKVSESPGVPGFVPGRVIMSSKEVGVQNVFRIPLEGAIGHQVTDRDDIVLTELQVSSSCACHSPCLK